MEHVVRIAGAANPTFETVTGLTNTTFDPEHIVSGRGATEDQLKILHDNCRELETQVELMENSETLNAIIATMRADVDDLQTTIENCCYTVISGNAEWNNTNNADISVGIDWDADPTANGGQVTAVSSSGADIVMYYFLVQKGDGIFLKMKGAKFAGKIVSVDTDTGEITVTDGTGDAMDKLIVGATDENGCEGLATFSVTSAPW